MSWAAAAIVVADRPATWPGLLAERLRAVGLRPVLLIPAGDDPQSIGVDMFDGTAFDLVSATARLHDGASLAASVLALTGGVTPAVLLTGADATMTATTAAAAQLGIGRCAPDAVAVARNKAATRDALAAAGLPGPGHAVITDAEQAADVAATVGLPAVIKPVNGAASSLVRRVNTVSELRAAYLELAAGVPRFPGELYRHAVPCADGTTIDPSTAFLVEGLLDGPEFCLDLLVRDGTIEFLPLIGKPLVNDAFYEDAFVMPPFDLDAAVADRVRAAAADAVRALGLDHCIVHIEIIDDATVGPTVVEVNAGRAGGAILPILTQLHAGVDVFAEQVALATGRPRPVAEPARLSVPVACLAVHTPSAGRLVAVDGLDEVADIPEILRVIPGVRPGDVLDGDSETFVVNLLAAGFADRDDLAALHEEVLRTVRVIVSPVHPTREEQSV